MSTTDRHDLRRQTREIREALSRYEREQLVDILTHVFRTYVMDGSALAAAPAAASGEELAGLSFAQVIERLQLRLDLPELQLFDVQGGRVSVRIDGRPTPLELPTPRNEGQQHLQVAVSLPPAPAAVAPSSPPPRAPGVEMREVVLPTPPAGQVPAGHASSARPDPRPGAVRATSAASARPSTAAAAAPATPSSSAGAASAAASPNTANKSEPQKPEPASGGGRFGLLEVD